MARECTGTYCGRDILVYVFGTDITLPDGTVVSVGRAQWAHGQIVGIGWLVIQVDGGPWREVEDQGSRSLLKLWQAVNGCTSRSDLEWLFAR